MTPEQFLWAIGRRLLVLGRRINYAGNVVENLGFRVHDWRLGIKPRRWDGTRREWVQT